MIEFYTNISEFEFYLLKFGGVWILHFKILKFGVAKFIHPQTLESEIQTPLKNFGGKIRIMKFRGIKSKYFQTSGNKI